MKVIYFFRHPKVGHSIHRVFRTLLQEMEGQVQIEVYDMPNRGSMPWDVHKNCWFTFKRRSKNAIHHVTGHIHDVLMALIRVKTVLTLHDLVFLDNVKNPIKRCYKWLFWLYLPIKIADKVVCISNQTKQNILRKVKTDKLVVIHNAIDPMFSYSKKDFNQEKPVILHIGTGWNKNLERTIEALEGVSCELRIIGALNKNQLQLLSEYKIDYSNQCDLSDEDIREEYTNCDIVNFPSVYEGFGMPVIEGQQTGRVVVTSRIEPIIEVAGDSVAYVSPNDLYSIRKTYRKVIEDAAYREELIEKGLENVKRFSVKNITKQYLELYQNLAKA